MEKSFGAKAESAQAIIKILLFSAQTNALEDAQMETLLEQKRILVAAGVPSDDHELKRVVAEISKHVVIAQNLAEYRMLLEATGVSDEKAIEVLSHENAHANVAESLNETFGGYALLVTKGTGGYKYLPFALTKVAEGEISREKAIARAPEAYGGTLSDADQARLKTIEGNNTQ